MFIYFFVREGDGARTPSVGLSPKEIALYIRCLAGIVYWDWDRPMARLRAANRATKRTWGKENIQSRLVGVEHHSSVQLAQIIIIH